MPPDSCASSSQNEKLTSNSKLVFQGERQPADDAWPDREANLNMETTSKKMGMLHLEEGATPRSAAHTTMLDLEDSSLLCRVSSLEVRCKSRRRRWRS